MNNNDFELGKSFGATAEQMRFACGLLANTYKGDSDEVNGGILADLYRCFPDCAFSAPKPSVEFSEERLATMEDLPPPKAKK